MPKRKRRLTFLLPLRGAETPRERRRRLKREKTQAKRAERRRLAEEFAAAMEAQRLAELAASDEEAKDGEE